MNVADAYVFLQQQQQCSSSIYTLFRQLSGTLPSYHHDCCKLCWSGLSHCCACIAQACCCLTLPYSPSAISGIICKCCQVSKIGQPVLPTWHCLCCRLCIHTHLAFSIVTANQQLLSTMQAQKSTCISALGACINMCFSTCVWQLP